MATNFQIWQHTSGDRYAVVCDDSAVVAALGPLNDAELSHVDAAFVHAHGDADDAAWMQTNRKSFQLVETRRGGWRNPASAANAASGGRPREKATFRRGEALRIERIPLAPGPDNPIPPAEAGTVLSVSANEIEIQIGEDILTIRREAAE